MTGMTQYAVLGALAAIVLFTALKLLGIITLSWWWLAVPGAVLLLAAMLVGLIILAVARGP
jgi:hypothetical protein